MHQVAGCSVGLRNAKGELQAKEWMIETSSDNLRNVLGPYKCSGGHEHAESMGGSKLWKTAIYTPMLAALCCEALVPN